MMKEYLRSGTLDDFLTLFNVSYAETILVLLDRADTGPQDPRRA